jgi:hypothetical protein
VKEREECWTLPYLKRRRETRIAYIRLFAKRELKISTTAESQTLQSMERELSVQDIKYFRTMTRRYLQMLRHEKEAEGESQLQKEIWGMVRAHIGDFATKDLDTAPNSGGWLSMIPWGSSSSKKEDPRWEESAREVSYVMGWDTPDEEKSPSRDDEDGNGEKPSRLSSDIIDRTSSDISRPSAESNTNGGKLPDAPLSYADVAAKPLNFGIEHVSPRPSSGDVFVHVDLRLVKGSLTLRRGYSSRTSDSNSTLADITFSGFRPIFRMYTQPQEPNAPPTWEFTSKLARLTVTDESNPDSKFKKIVQAPRPSEGLPDVKSDEEVDFEDPALWDNPLLLLNAAQLSPKTGYNMRIEMRLEESLIFYHKQFVEEIVRFFRPPDKHETLNALFDSMMEATKEYANETIDSLRTAEQPMTRSALEFAINETKANIIELNLKAPLIIFPENVTDFNSRCIGLDFGILSIKNAARDALSPAVLRRMSLAELHDRAADIYAIDVENVQVALSDSVPSLTLNGAKGWDNAHHLIPKISLKSFAKLAFRPPKTVPRAEISAIAENLSAAISDTQIQAIRTIVLQLIPHLDDNPSTPPTKTITPDDQERKIDPTFTDAEINRMRNKEAFLLALQLDVTQAAAEVTTNTHGELAKGQDRFLHVNAAGLKLRTRLFAYNYWAEAELHGATISTADAEPLLISDSDLPIVKVSYEDKLAPVPIGPNKKVPPRILRCDIGKVKMNVPERIWEFIENAQKMVEFEGQKPSIETSSEVTLPAELLPQDETLIFLDVDDVQLALWEEREAKSKKVATLNLEALQVKLRQTSPDSIGEDDVILRKMTAMVQRFTCQHHLHETADEDFCKVLDFGGGKTPATLDFIQFDRTSPHYPGWATSINANITQDILFNIDQDPLSHILRYIIKVQSRKPPEPAPTPRQLQQQPSPDEGLSEFKFDVHLQRVVANLFKPGTFKSHSKDHISIEVGNISARDLIHSEKKLPTLAKIAIDPITIHSRSYEKGEEKQLTILSGAKVNVDALLEKVIETETHIALDPFNIRPLQLRMILDFLGVLGQTMPLAMQAKDSLTGAPAPPPPVVHKEGSEVTTMGKHTLEVTGFDVELLSSASQESMLGLRLPDIQLSATMTSDGDTTVLLDVKSFNVVNPRSEYFRDTVPASTESPYQLVVRAILPQDKSRPMEVVTAITNPELILDVDAIASVLAEILSFKSELQEAPKAEPSQPGGPMPLIELTMQMPRLTLLEDSSDPNTNAMTMSAEYIALDTTEDSLFKVMHACVYQHKMQSKDQPLLFVDHFNVDAHKEGQKWKGTVDPIVVRISPKDIRFALSLQKNILPKVNKITQLMASDSPAPKVENAQPTDVPEVLAQILTKSHYQLVLGGMRVVFIGDMPEIPILDMKIKQFTIDMQAWDNFKEINVLTSTIATSFNMYNFAKSKWEPIIESWEVNAQFGLHQPPNPQIEFNVSSGKRLDFVVSTRTVDMVALLQRMFARISSESPGLTPVIGFETQVTPTTAPYRIVNRTGVPIEVWSDQEHQGGTPKSVIENEEAIPWRFDSWRSLRENVNIDTEGNLLNFKLKGTPYNNIERVPVNMETNRPYRLKPSDTPVAHHVLCEVKLGPDNVKEVIVRSTYLIENASLNEIECLMIHQDGGHTQVTIEPGHTYAVPVLIAQSCRIQVRPPHEYGYEWSEAPFIWQDFLRKEPTRAIRCRSGAAASFNLIGYALINKSTPLASQYPFMTLRISTPLKVVNLLPYEVKYHLYDKRLQEKFINTVKSGDSSPVHSVELSHLLLMAVEVAGSTYEGSEYSVINADDPREFRRETQLNFKNKRGGHLHLGLHYLDIANSGGALEVSIYAPYLVWNLTAADVEIKPKSFLRSADVVSYQLKASTHPRYAY